MAMLVPKQSFFNKNGHKHTLDDDNEIIQNSQPLLKANNSLDDNSELLAAIEASQSDFYRAPLIKTNGGIAAGEEAIHLPEDRFHYEHIGEVPQRLRKYFHQRFDLFSLYDYGIKMTDDAWFGVSPEPVAMKIAERMSKDAPTEKKILIDAFCGAGGNTIAFAKSDRWDQIIAIDHNPEVLACAKANAALYGVSDKISWHLGDCFEFISGFAEELRDQCVIFASPPWGGPGYTSDEIFNLSTMQPYSLESIIKPFSKVTSEIALFLPRTSDVRQLAEFVPHGKRITVVQYCVKGATKGMCAYYGGLSPSTIAAPGIGE